MKLYNTTVEAQQNCLKAVSQLSNELARFFEEAEKLEYLTDVEITVKPYNDGYELKVEFQENEKSWMDSKMYRIFSGMSHLYIQPESFFEITLKRGEKARYEGQCLSFNENYCSYRHEVDVQDSTNLYEFINLNRETIREATEKLS